MPPCHVRPFVSAGVLLEPHAAQSIRDGDSCDAVAPTRESCDYCGSDKLEWRKCKLICTDCRQINKSCADL